MGICSCCGVCACLCVYVARVKSKSFVLHKSAGSSGDVRTERLSAAAGSKEGETGERNTERERECRTAAVRPPSHTCHTGSERWPLFPGYTSSNTAPGGNGRRTSVVRETDGQPDRYTNRSMYRDVWDEQ